MFNKVENYGYDGILPDLKFYDPDSLKEPARSNLLKWHEENKTNRFNFSKEIEAYCIADVRLLKDGCMAFRSSFMRDTGSDPFMSITIAGACMRVFRNRFLTKDTIAWEDTPRRVSLHQKPFVSFHAMVNLCGEH